MRYTGIQPQYFPRLHYFARIINTDLFMIRDDAQFVRKHKYPDGKNDKSYQADTPIKTPLGRALLCVPVEHNGLAPLYQTNLSKGEWIDDTLKTIYFNYAKSQYYKTRSPHLEQLLHFSYDSLSDLNITTILWSLQYILGIKNMTKKPTLTNVNTLLKKQNVLRLREIVKATETKSFQTFSTLSANEKIISLCKEFGITEDYCGGTSISAYVDHALFEKNNIKIIVQDWTCQTYPQQFMKARGFLPNLSILDLLMNVSGKDAMNILKG